MSCHKGIPALPNARSRRTFAALCAQGMGWYREWFGTEDYARLYGHRDEGEARLWVEALLDHWRLGPGSHVLDMACGRGRHAFWFVRSGMKVTGIDISPESLAQAQERVPEARFALHDIREPYAQEAFDACCCLFTSMGYFDDPADDAKVFAAAYQALRPGGVFTLDFMNSARVLAYLVPEEQLGRSGVDFHIQRSVENGTLVKRITASDSNGTRHYEERVRVLDPGTLGRMAVEAGFIVEDRTDGPRTSPFILEHSERLVLWCRKPSP